MGIVLPYKEAMCEIYGWKLGRCGYCGHSIRTFDKMAIGRVYFIGYATFSRSLRRLEKRNLIFRKWVKGR